jgi:sulfhydrogenase subunit beta (sulfur reductase)
VKSQSFHPTTKILPKSELPAFLRRLQDERQLFAPVRRNDRVVWARVRNPELPLLEFSNTALSPKEFFLPQTECLLRFSPRGEKAGLMQEPEQELSPRVLFNVRPCDARALLVLDRVFGRDEPDGDPYWRARRERTLLVGLACAAPCATCFCTATQCGPHHEEGLDLLLVDLEDRFLVRVLTEKGVELAASLPTAGPAELEKALEQRTHAEECVASQSKSDGERVPQRELSALFELGIWKRLAETCLNCGACTFVCPTCHCFDIQDETKGAKGRRVRNWDTCMSPLFTRHASGHNPRGSKTARLRQRFLHKFSYMPTKLSGALGCVGCGRCITACPVNIDIREVIEEMAEVRNSNSEARNNAQREKA